MNSQDLDVRKIYEMARDVVYRLGKPQTEVEGVWGLEYTDEHIHICRLQGIMWGSVDMYDSFRVYQKQEGQWVRVLEWHTVNREITDKMDLLRDMLHHDFCGKECPGFGGVVAKRAYEIFKLRDYEPGHELDDWLLAEAEILEELKLRFAGDWEVAVLEGGVSEHLGPAHCVILRRGEWIDHLRSLASTL